VFLYCNRGESPAPDSTGLHRKDDSDCKTPRTAATDQLKALVNAAKFTAARFRIAARARELNETHNRLISKGYFVAPFSPIFGCAPAGPHRRPSFDKLVAYLKLFLRSGMKKRHAARLVCVFCRVSQSRKCVAI
jgi:hypothetical protein